MGVIWNKDIRSRLITKFKKEVCWPLSGSVLGAFLPHCHSREPPTQTIKNLRKKNVDLCLGAYWEHSCLIVIQGNHPPRLLLVSPPSMSLSLHQNKNLQQHNHGKLLDYYNNQHDVNDYRSWLIGVSWRGLGDNLNRWLVCFFNQSFFKFLTVCVFTASWYHHYI